jgi:hypothetical protein
MSGALVVPQLVWTPIVIRAGLRRLRLQSSAGRAGAMRPSYRVGAVTSEDRWEPGMFFLLFIVILVIALMGGIVVSKFLFFLLLVLFLFRGRL